MVVSHHSHCLSHASLIHLPVVSPIPQSVTYARSLLSLCACCMCTPTSMYMVSNLTMPSPVWDSVASLLLCLFVPSLCYDGVDRRLPRSCCSAHCSSGFVCGLSVSILLLSLFFYSPSLSSSYSVWNVWTSLSCRFHLCASSSVSKVLHLWSLLGCNSLSSQHSLYLSL